MSETSTWVVTGACSGIGAAVATMAAASGANVLALDVNDTAGEALAAATGVTYQHCDVGNPDDWAAVVTTLGTIGVPTHVHLNAGIQIAPPDAPLEDYRFEAMVLERYRRMMSVNVDGVVFGLQALLPLMAGGSAVVVTSSLAGITPYAIDPLYAMSKHAVSGLVRSMGLVLKDRDIRINAICPGGVDTGIIPDAQRQPDALFMTAEKLAEEVMTLMTVPETGKTWAKVAEDKPVFIVRAPGDRDGKR